ncbi:ATP-binding protein [Demequina capsici]|uniref:histidine kinase n=1 Tax=Demequina capsici TaxID=3075620 RepID=A0AA96J6Y6_9MICO|nr:ATP-binding protein [Demequina sp. OYTSA14]WNM24687.1 ATP-binding protein [Demequina sp. OYTSA14]
MTQEARGASAWRALAAAPRHVVAARSSMLDDAAARHVFHAVAEASAHALGADGAVVWVEHDGSHLVIGASGLGDAPEAVAAEWSVRTLEGVSPVGIDDARADGATAQRVGAYLGVPLILNGETVGVLAVVTAGPRAWDAEDRARLVSLAQWPTAEIGRIDSTARLRVAEAALVRATQVFDAMGEGIVGLDSEGAVTLVNPAAARMLGWEPAALIGQLLHHVAHYQRPDGSAYPLDQCPMLLTIADGQVRTRRHEVLWRRDGSALHVDMSVGGLRDDAGAAAAIVVFDDISERLDLERSREDFVSMVSHELRTPLTAISGSLELMDELGDDPESAAQMLGIARRNASRMAGLVDDILDLERAETGRLQLTRSQLDAQSVMMQAAEAVSGMATAGQVALIVEPTQTTFWGDESRIVQVLTNLAGNAVRLSPPGAAVTMRAHEAETEVSLEVADHGPGIAEADQQHIFDRFWQAPAGAGTGRKGSGLGLAIALSMARAHGGTITVRSLEGLGSTFTLHVPLRARRSAVPIDRRDSQEPS